MRYLILLDNEMEKKGKGCLGKTLRGTMTHCGISVCPFSTCYTDNITLIPTSSSPAAPR